MIKSDDVRAAAERVRRVSVRCQTEYAGAVADRLRKAGLRVEIDRSGVRMQAKIRAAQLQKVPWMLVVGKREVEAGRVSVRLRSGDHLGAMPVDAFLDLAQPVIETKSLDLQLPRDEG